MAHRARITQSKTSILQTEYICMGVYEHVHPVQWSYCWLQLSFNVIDLVHCVHHGCFVLQQKPRWCHSPCVNPKSQAQATVCLQRPKSKKTHSLHFHTLDHGRYQNAVRHTRVSIILLIRTVSQRMQSVAVMAFCRHTKT